MSAHDMLGGEWEWRAEDVAGSKNGKQMSETEGSKGRAEAHVPSSRWTCLVCLQPMTAQGPGASLSSPTPPLPATLSRPWLRSRPCRF